MSKIMFISNFPFTFLPQLFEGVYRSKQFNSGVGNGKSIHGNRLRRIYIL